MEGNMMPNSHLSSEASARSEAGTSPKSVAVIGGGISGLYAAWRLARAVPDCKIDIFEADGRLGGRIRSEILPGISFCAELGAMRFRSSHALLSALLRELRIPTRRFDVRAPQLRVRGRMMSSRELTDDSCMRCGAKGPYLLRDDERGQSPEALILSAIRTLLKDLSFPGLNQGDAHRAKQRILEGEISAGVWKTIKESGWYENTPLHKIGFWNLLQHYLSNEAVEFVRAALSLESILGNWSAAEAIPWFVNDFSSNEFLMVPDGMAEVSTRIESELKTGCTSDGIRKFDPTRVRVQRDAAVARCIRMGDPIGWSLEFHSPSGHGDEVYDQIIIALPRVALKKLEIRRKDGRRWEPRWMSDVEPHVMYKLFLLYEREWWMGDDTPGYAVGRTYTDLPLRQVYYFSPRWMELCAAVGSSARLRQQSLDDAKHWSLVMASYSDEHHVSFWRGFAGVDESGPYFRPPSGLSKDGEAKFMQMISEIDPRIRASERIVKKVQRQLQEIHGHNVPEPILGLYKEWGAEPFGGGWHTWNVGTEPWLFVGHKTANNDWPDDLYICGEAYSAEQGWIEGALKTTEVAMHHMRIPKAEYDFAFDVESLEQYIGIPGERTQDAPVVSQT